ncbi:hypothetical protein DFH09DRAFT_1077920 [Mycena vulgaris]|nr:hypothetical protein DFH09DRAFT_1077920 [Mycena vulgaris]
MHYGQPFLLVHHYGPSRPTSKSFFPDGESISAIICRTKASMHHLDETTVICNATLSASPPSEMTTTLWRGAERRIRRQQGPGKVTRFTVQNDLRPQPLVFPHENTVVGAIEKRTGRRHRRACAPSRQPTVPSCANTLHFERIFDHEFPDFPLEWGRRIPVRSEHRGFGSVVVRVMGDKGGGSGVQAGPAWIVMAYNIIAFFQVPT